MDSPFHYPITIRLEPVEGEPINGEEMFVARCEHFPELAMAEGSPQRAEAMIEKVWAVEVDNPKVESKTDGFKLAGYGEYLDSSRD